MTGAEQRAAARRLAGDLQYFEDTVVEQALAGLTGERFVELLGLVSAEMKARGITRGTTAHRCPACGRDLTRPLHGGD